MRLRGARGEDASNDQQGKHWKEKSKFTIQIRKVFLSGYLLAFFASRYASPPCSWPLGGLRRLCAILVPVLSCVYHTCTSRPTTFPRCVRTVPGHVVSVAWEPQRSHHGRKPSLNLLSSVRCVGWMPSFQDRRSMKRPSRRGTRWDLAAQVAASTCSSSMTPKAKQKTLATPRTWQRHDICSGSSKRRRMRWKRR